ncbi:MAG: phosphomannomutase [Sulfurovum sp.]|nr:phosphomannomutase [Sulfurovaceae bacterium]
MLFTIEDGEFNTKDIKQLYPAGIVKTGYQDETTEVSLEWLEVEAKDKVEIVGYAIFIYLKSNTKISFIYKTKALLDKAIGELSKQLQ